MFETLLPDGAQAKTETTSTTQRVKNLHNSGTAFFFEKKVNVATNQTATRRRQILLEKIAGKPANEYFRDKARE